MGSCSEPQKQANQVTMEWLIAIALFVLTFGFVAFYFTSDKPRKTRKRRAAMSAGLFAINEIFHPAANETAIVLEEKREARTPLPSPEDKENPAQ